MTTYENSPRNDCEQMELTGLTSSAEASPVNRFPLPGSNEARKITATSGRKCSALCKSASPIGSLARMLLASSKWHSATCLLTWRAQGTKSNRLLYRLVPSMPPTEGIGSGLLPTARAEDSESCGGHRGALDSLTAYTRMFSTPLASDGRGSAGIGKKELPNFVKMWPPPTGSMVTMGDLEQARWAGSNPNRPRYKEASKGVGQLNPEWVEWLMGYPAGWTDLEDSATQ